MLHDSSCLCLTYARRTAAWYIIHPAGKEQLLQILSPVQGGLMWRNSMADVAADLGLPPQHQVMTTLQLSAIERHFYTRQHQVSIAV